MKVGYLGPEGMTFGYMAAKAYFAGEEDAELVPYLPQEAIATAVRRNEFDYGVMAVENVIGGAVMETLDAVHKEHDRGVRVCGETTIRIEMTLFRAIPDGNGIKRIVSHQKAIQQCSKFVSEMIRAGVEVSYADSTGAAAEAALENPEVAVLGPPILKEVLGFHPIRESVADNPENFTRFWIVGYAPTQSTGKDKTAVLISLPQDVPGGVYRALKPFAERRINLCYLYACPISGRLWEYDFLLEFEGHMNDPSMEEALDQLDEGGCKKSVLGSYPNTTWNCRAAN